MLSKNPAAKNLGVQNPVEVFMGLIISLEQETNDLAKIRDMAIRYQGDLQADLADILSKIRDNANTELLAKIEQELGGKITDKIKKYVEREYKNEPFASLKEYIEGPSAQGFGGELRYRRKYRRLTEFTKTLLGSDAENFFAYFGGIGVEQFVDHILNELNYEEKVALQIPLDIRRLRAKVAAIKKQWVWLPEEKKAEFQSLANQLESLESSLDLFAEVEGRLKNHQAEFHHAGRQRLIEKIKFYLEEKVVSFTWEYSTLLIAKEFESIVDEAVMDLEYVVKTLNWLIENILEEVALATSISHQPQKIKQLIDAEETPKPAHLPRPDAPTLCSALDRFSAKYQASTEEEITLTPDEQTLITDALSYAAELFEKFGRTNEPWRRFLELLFSHQTEYNLSLTTQPPWLQNGGATAELEIKKFPNSVQIIVNDTLYRWYHQMLFLQGLTHYAPPDTPLQNTTLQSLVRIAMSLKDIIEELK